MPLSFGAALEGRREPATLLCPHCSQERSAGPQGIGVCWYCKRPLPGLTPEEEASFVTAVLNNHAYQARVRQLRKWLKERSL